MADDARPLLTARHLEIAERLVAEGHCDSVASAIEEALESYRSHIDARALTPPGEAKALEAFLEARRKGPFVSMEAFSDMVDDLIAEMYAKHDVPR